MALLGLKKKIADTFRKPLKQAMGMPEGKPPAGGPGAEAGAGREYDFGLPPLDGKSVHDRGTQFYKSLDRLRNESPGKYHKLITHLIRGIPDLQPKAAEWFAEQVRTDRDLANAFHQVLTYADITVPIARRSPEPGLVFKGDLKNAAQLLCANRDDVGFWLHSLITEKPALFDKEGLKLRDYLRKAKMGLID